MDRVNACSERGMAMGKAWSVEAVAGRLGITTRTLHYYEEVGLIPPVQRTPGGHRVYDEATIARLEQILRLRDVLGYTLQEIREVMDVEDVLQGYRVQLEAGVKPEVRMDILEHSIQLLETVVAHIDEKVERLETMRQRYRERLARIEQKLAKHRNEVDEGE